MCRKRQVLPLAGLAALLVALSSPALAQHPVDTLQNRAKAAGGTLLWRYRPNNSSLYANIEELSKRTDVIVVGRTVMHRSTLRPDGKFITEDFQVIVQEVIKGDLSTGKVITVSLPGGIYKFPDGTLANVLPRGYKKPEDHTTYVFFLKNKGAIYQGHQLASETQGLFALKDGKVEPADLVRDHPVVMKYKGMGIANFLGEIHKAVPLKKK